MIRFHVTGIDLSLNHAGFVRLNTEAELVNWGFVTSTASNAEHPRGTMLPQPEGKMDEQAIVNRLDWWRRSLHMSLHREDKFSEYVGIEDYAFEAKGSHQYQTGAIGGMARLEALRAGSFLRLLATQSMKLFATGKGNAKAPDIVKGVWDSWRVSFAEVTRPARAGCKPDTQAEEDLCAAYAVARMVWTEVMLREGSFTLRDLPKHQADAFMRRKLLERNFLHFPKRTTDDAAFAAEGTH